MKFAFAETLTQLAEKDSRLVLLTGDLGFQLFDDFRDRFGPRYLNAGVAEAQMICAAAGLALEGFRPLTYSIASFHVGRPYEQIRVSVGYPQLPVVIVGAGGGYGYAHSGVTHHSANDLLLMGSVPGMTLVVPGDQEEVKELLPQVLETSGPCYFRIGRGGEKRIKTDARIQFGRGRLLREGSKMAVLSTGDLGGTVLEALDLLVSEKIFPVAYQFHTVKPLDTDLLDRLAESVETILTVEEHIPEGGLNGAVNTWRMNRLTGPRLVRLGPPNELALGNLHPADLRKRLGYDAPAIADQCRSLWRQS